jgi:hypothetical protein
MPICLVPLREKPGGTKGAKGDLSVVFLTPEFMPTQARFPWMLLYIL